jgi:hypothetical protein
LRPSDSSFRPAWRLAALATGAALLALEAGCTPHVLVAVDPDPCEDGGCADPCADGGCFPPGLLQGLVGYWRFDDGFGSMTAVDSSGNMNTGTLERLMPTMAWVPGNMSGGAIGIYAGGWVGVADSASLDQITNQVTVSAWVYFDGVVDASMYGTAISRQVGNSVLEQHYHLSLFGQGTDARPHLFIRTVNGTDILGAPDTVPQQKWTHMAGTYDGATVRLYVNGAEISNMAMPLTGAFESDTTPLVIGGNDNDTSGVPTELFPGSLDEIMLYKRALSAAEIADLYKGPGRAIVDAGATD